MMMMLIFLAKRRLCSPHIHPLLPRLFSSASAIPNPDHKTPTFDAADYLISSFGFSPDKAARVSRTIAHLKSPENPDSVLCFLKDQGFACIEKLITSRPQLLCSSPEKTLDPNLRSIRDMGLSASAVNQIILSGPQALQLQSTVPRIRFWMDFFDGDELALVTAFKRNFGLVGYDIGRLVSPKISLLRSHGFSTQEIQMIVCKVPRLITSKISGSRMEDLLKRTEELGFQRNSGIFLQGFLAMAFNTRDVLQKKMILLMSFGWSEEEFLSALRKAPTFVMLTEKNLQTKMAFFVGEANCELSCIVSHPLLLKFSLEKRLRPRNNVLHRLKLKGLPVKEQSFSSAMNCTDKRFVDKYILPHKEEISGLHEAYIAACA